MAHRQKVFVTRSDYPEKGIRMLREKYDVEIYPHPLHCPVEYMLEHIRGASALFCISFDKIGKEVIEAAGPQLKIIVTFSLGYEHIDVDECRRRGIVVCNSSNPVSVSVVAEFTVGLLLAVARKIAPAAGAVQRNEWSEIWSPSWYLGRGLTNATVGIVGMGRIGQAVLERILPFGVSKVFYYDLHKPIAAAEAKGAEYAPFEDLLKNSDFVIATCNLCPESAGLFDHRAFSIMRPHAVFVNTSRGGVVVQEALIDALKTNRIRGAGIDVMYPEPLPREHELASLPNIVITPHIAAAEEIAMEELGLVCARNIVEVLEGRAPLTPVY
ncbi:hypothetical protein JTE90_020475 [Oedothorax gibbosus]|uniref:Glyoxylate reductase/hydroxypyruvate reductase n=1 Tax=Oedothorax gibbosus TaxID=931172 RepID=A0AAV6U7L9_9ARAC|nr:hypothetical protein JTE90_020475 [Oedothorax gibbosus]